MRVCKVFPSTVDTYHIIFICLALMVKLSTAITCTLSMHKLSTLKHRLGLRIYGTTGICKYPALTTPGREQLHCSGVP